MTHGARGETDKSSANEHKALNARATDIDSQTFSAFKYLLLLIFCTCYVYTIRPCYNEHIAW